MKCRLSYFTFFLILILFPFHAQAFEQVYDRKTSEIYATARNDLTIYSYDYSDDVQTVLPQYHGIKVIQKNSSWYEIEYTYKNKTRTGWITKSDFYSDCLIYDGRQKQILANGTYKTTYITATYPLISSDENCILSDHLSGFITVPTAFDCYYEYIGDGLFMIRQTNTGLYLQADPQYEKKNGIHLWGARAGAGKFNLIRDGKYFGIQDHITKRYLSGNENNILVFMNETRYSWRLRRLDNAITDDSIRLFAQFDAEWANTYYGRGKNPEPYTNVFCTSACGIFSTLNAIYSLTGMYADPYALADYAVRKNYRILDNGTDSGIFKAAATEFGDQYGFMYAGSSGSIAELNRHLKKGEVAIAHVPGHYVAIAKYSMKKRKYLLLDPHYLPKRATFAYGDWVPQSALEEGNLMGQMFYFYRKTAK